MRRTFAPFALASAVVWGCGSPTAESPAEPAGGNSTAPAADTPTAAESSTKAPASVTVEAVTPEQLRAKIASDHGKAVLVDFWATWCIPCRKQYPHTVELANKHRDDLVVYSVSMDGDGPADDETKARVEKFLAENAGDVRTLISANGGDESSYTAFEITEGALPHYKVFDREGALVATFGGNIEEPIDPAKIDAAVQAAIGK